MRSEQSHKTRTLWLCGALHGFTHVYHVALMPLYLMIQQDLKLTQVGDAPFMLTLQGLVCFVPSYLMGVWADRFSRKNLLGIGLLINGLGFVALACAPSYGWALAAVTVAGIGGSFYHPSATALLARMFPATTGRALGLAGIGSSVGFFVGPIYSGWRAVSSGSWRTPTLELGVLGVVMAAVFVWLAEETPGLRAEPKQSASAEKMFATPWLWFLFIVASLAFSLRDFAGGGMASLGSLFLQQAHQLDPEQTGLALSGIYLASAVSNPLFGRLSDHGRIRWMCLVLVVAAVMIAVFPHVPKAGLVPVYVIYGFFFMASYPVTEAAVIESVHDSVRGRVYGLFITVGGLVGNLAHWQMGFWVKGLGAGANLPSRYYPLYALLALLVTLSLVGLPCLHAIRRREVRLGQDTRTARALAGRVGPR